MEEFFAFVRTFGAVAPQDLELVRARYRTMRLPQGEFFLRPGQVCHRIGFVQKGVARVFIHGADGQEVIRAFVSERNFMVDIHSYHNQSPSVEYWEVLADMEMLYWERPDLEYMRENIAAWHKVTVNMAQKILLDAALERTEMFNDDATTRYQKFVQRYPHVVQRVPLRHIANYLGIAPQSLSRIRQQSRISTEFVSQ
jgi:CRP-like cAMP-binding protein